LPNLIRAGPEILSEISLRGATRSQVPASTLTGEGKSARLPSSVVCSFLTPSSVSSKSRIESCLSHTYNAQLKNSGATRSSLNGDMKLRSDSWVATGRADQVLVFVFHLLLNLVKLHHHALFCAHCGWLSEGSVLCAT